MNRRILWLIGLLVPVVLIFGGIADRAIVDQARSAESAALSEANRIARMAALSVRATLARHEIAVVAEDPPPGVTVYRVVLSSRHPLSRDSSRPYRGRTASELDDLTKNSNDTTAQGLPEAVVAAIARGTRSAKAEAADRLLSGRLPVHPDALSYLALDLGVSENARVESLRALLSAALARGSLPDIPDFRRTLTERGTIEGWSRRGDQGVGYEVAVSALLEAAQVPFGAKLAGHRSPTDDLEGYHVVSVPDVDGLELAVPAELRNIRPVRMLRTVLWAAVLTSLAGLGLVLRAVSREAAAVSRERAFLATVTHELRTPVAALRLFGETLAKGRGNPREYGALVAQESERLEALIERVLTTTRMDEVPSFTRVRPGEIVGSAVQLVAARAQRRGVTIDWKSEGASVLEATWDGDAVRQALLNLLDNAIKHGRRGGHVEVRAALENESLKLSVSDDGPGIERRDRKRIFQRFQRGGTQSAGTGLGLYVVEQVANAHGGSVDLLTGAGKGCTFTLVLPLEPPGAQPALDVEVGSV